MKIEDIIEAITMLFNFQIVEETDEKIVFSILVDKTASLNKIELNKIIEDLNKYKSDQEVELYDNNTYEVLIRNERRMMIAREVTQIDSVNKIDYNVGKPSNNYIVFFLYNLSQQDTPQILKNYVSGLRLKRFYDSEEFKNNEVDIFDILKEAVMRLETLKIKSETTKRKNEFEQLVYAFLFNLGYNLDHIISPLRFMEEFTQTYRIRRLRRANVGDVEPPKRIYINELILHYQKGISSESIDHQYLSFYHILEHFF